MCSVSWSVCLSSGPCVQFRGLYVCLVVRVFCLVVCLSSGPCVQFRGLYVCLVVHVFSFVVCMSV